MPQKPTLEIKDPSESSKKYSFDLEAWMTALDTTIASVTSVAATPSGLTVASNSNDSYVVNVFLTGGTADIDYQIDVTFVTADGQTLIATAVIPVRQK